MSEFKRGLIVGKFCPLHNGHVLLIKRAQAACETLYIISYSNPEFDGCTPARRRTWLEKAAPDAKICVVGHDVNLEIPANSAPDDIHREFTANIFAEYFEAVPNAVFTSESYGDGFANYLSRYFEQAVTHINIDQSRTFIPVSGTHVRDNIYNHKDFVPVYVYQDFIQSVLLLGGESTGKSTITKHMANTFNEPYVEEYGRTLWEQQNGELSFSDYMKIAKTHIEYEDVARLQAERYIFVDTSPLTTLFYGLEQYGEAAPELITLTNRRYDHIFLAHPDFPMVQDGTRQDETFRLRQHNWYIEQLTMRGMRYTDLKGNLEDKLQTIENTLARTG